jgi:hypothetical protein
MMEGRSVLSPNDLPKGRRPLVIGVGVAVAVLAAGGVAAVALTSRDADADAARSEPAPPPAAATTPPASTGTAGGPQNGAAGAVRMEATRLVDGHNDVRTDAGAKGPAWADLTEVSWQRAGDGATVTFTTAAAVPASLPAGASASFGTYLHQDDDTVLVSARLDGETWRVRASDTGRPTDLEVTPRVSGNTVSFDLPGQISTATAQVDVNKPAKVRAVSNARMSETTAYTDACTGTDSADTEADW